MAEPQNKSNDAKHEDEFDRFDEAQPFLQLLADMLDRMTGKPQTDQMEGETSEPERATG